MLAPQEQGWYNSCMKLFLALLFLAGLYLAGMFYTTNVVLAQTKQLNATYQYVANNADQIATGQDQSGQQ